MSESRVLLLVVLLLSGALGGCAGPRDSFAVQVANHGVHPVEVHVVLEKLGASDAAVEENVTVDPGALVTLHTERREGSYRLAARVGDATAAHDFEFARRAGPDALQVIVGRDGRVDVFEAIV